MSWLRFELARYRWLYLVWLLWFGAFVLLVRSTLGGPDGVRYMSYLRSLIFDHDILLFNELENFGQRIIITPSGYSAQIANIGVLIFWLPFYVLGMATAWLSGDLGNGLTVHYQFWLDFGDWLYGLLALWVMYRWTCTRFASRTALLATLLMGLGSPFVYYMTALAPSYHTISALLCAIFFYLWDATRHTSHATRARSFTQWFSLGLLIGLLMSMAQYHAILLVFLISDLQFSISDLRQSEIRNQKSKIIHSLLAIICVMLGLLLPLIPQFITWGIVFGNPFANPYTLEADWSGARLPDVLFSPYHGLYFTAPILLLATFGWIWVMGEWMLSVSNGLRRNRPAPTTDDQRPATDDRRPTTDFNSERGLPTPNPNSQLSTPTPLLHALEQAPNPSASRTGAGPQPPIPNSRPPTPDPQLALGALIALLFIAYSSSTRIGWWGGVSFGARYFIGLTPLFVMGLARLLAINVQSPTPHSPLPTPHSPLPTPNPQPPPPNPQPAIVLLSIAAAFWTYGYFLQAYSALTSFSEYHSARVWIGNQWIVLQNLRDLLALHWAAPRSDALITNWYWCALVSLLILRLAVVVRQRHLPRLIALFALVPIGLSVWLLSSIAPSEANKQTLAASGFYEKNRARDTLDFESFSGEYVERARYHQIIGDDAQARADFNRALAIWPVKNRKLVSDDDAKNFQPLNLKFGDDVELVGYQIEALKDDPAAVGRINCPVTSPSCTFKLRLLWRANTRLPADYDVGVLLLDTQGQVITRTAPTLGLDPFPATWWLPGQLISDEHTLDAAPFPRPSLIRLRVELFDANAKKRLPITRDGKAHNGIIAEVKRATDKPISPIGAFSFGDKLSLNVPQVNRDATGLNVVLSWNAPAPIEKDYTIFIHLLDAQNRIVAQSDVQPLGGRYPTHAWERGENVDDLHRIALAPDQLARIVRIAFGLYDAASGARLPVRATIALPDITATTDALIIPVR